MSIYNEVDYSSLTLSDKNVVKYLILYRSKIDFSYNANTNIDINKAGDIFEVNQEVIALYASLDELIRQCNFKEKQMKLLDLLFKGNIVQDIYNMNIGYGKSATYELLNRMIEKIVDKNYQLWKESMRVQGYIKDERGVDGED